jgi:hypothetical protein
MSTGLVNGVTSGVVAAIRKAAEATGSGFAYLLHTGMRESDLDPTAQARGSSAAGIFQFTRQTWLATLKQAGPGLGLGAVAAKITRDANGGYSVADPADRQRILALREDPATSALMAGALAKSNSAALQAALGRPPTDGELYVAHFLGAQGATSLFSLAASSPQSPAAAAFPAAAAANRSIFYADGKPLGAAAVVARLTAGESTAGGTRATALAFADSSSTAPNPADIPVDEHGPVFYSIFRTGRRTPVAAYVDAAWSGIAATTAIPAPVTSGPGAAVPSPKPAVAPAERPAHAAPATAAPRHSRRSTRPLDLLSFLRSAATEDA